MATNWKCSACGLRNSGSDKVCRRCNANMYVQVHQQQTQAYGTDQSQKVNRGGKTCPRCEVTNSYSKRSGELLTIVLAVLTCGIALLIVPLLPKTWHCRHCGCVW